MSTDLYKPNSRGMRGPQDNGSESAKIVHPPRYAQIGGLTSAKKIGGKNSMTVRRPGGEK